jgi:hypothetical protein
MFRSNQSAALAVSRANNFASGVHFHATGTGKSWIALQLLLDFQAAHGCTNILWICEQKSILIEQFAKETLKSRGFSLRSFLVLDYTVQKPADWVQHVNSATIWRKPLLILINRAFLTSATKYTQLRLPIHLVIHDECHSITNTTTQAFYTWLLAAHPTVRTIGFSATPTLTHAPYTQLLSSYTTYDAVKDGVIVPPRILWLKKEGGVGDAEVQQVLQKLVATLPYKKILVWCGMIAACQELAKEWSQHSTWKDWMFAVDTSEPMTGWASYADFQARETKGFLFCANKHREGSDIPGLDGCVFLDRVANRNAKTFLQCMGRVLRRDPAGRKTFGLVLDICAASSIKVCDRIQQYIDPERTATQFPFHYTCTTQDSLQIHELVFQTKYATKPMLPICTDLETLFVRPLPADPLYAERLRHEMGLLQSKELVPYLMRALDILAITRNIPHVTRGSCGSSLVCYMLGISHVDPIRWGIRFARFLNEYRNTLPDIDFDFPYNLRDEVFLQIQMRWPGQVARISNHVYYHKKSAMREAVRSVGIRKMIPALQLQDTIRRLPLKKQWAVQKRTKELENTFRCYSLHCGGIVMYPAGIPKSLVLKSKKGAMSQITLNKQDVAKDANFKIDVLSSRALAQLQDARKYAGLPPVDFEAFPTDAPTAALFRRGDNIGITLAESPLIRKAFMKLRPSTIDGVAACLAIIRPAAREARVATTAADLTALFVYDDDAIEIVGNALGCGDAEADRFRRGFAKGDKATVQELKKALVKVPDGPTVLTRLRNLRQYSFCKSHAFSYAQLVWQLGYMKANYPAAFWRATLQHCESSYRKWVHLYEARCVGVEPQGKQQSIYADHRRSKVQKTWSAASPADQLRHLGIWQQASFFPDTYMRIEGDQAEIRGILASSRVLSWDTKIKRAILFVGVGSQQYAEVLVAAPYLALSGKVGITCRATRNDDVWETADAAFW